MLGPVLPWPTPRPLPPEAVRAAAGVHLAAPVVAWEPLLGGYTPQAVLRLFLADGRQAVLKAASALSDPTGAVDWVAVLGREIRAYHSLPMLRHWQPVVSGTFDVGGWTVLLLEDLGGLQRVPPWTAQSIETAAAELARLHAATLGRVAPAGTVPDVDIPTFFGQFTARGRQLGDLPPAWDCEAGWKWLAEACRVGTHRMEAALAQVPRCVAHGDVRSDNLFLDGGDLRLIDWAESTWTSPARDSVYWALGVEIRGGGDARAVHARYLAHAPDVPPVAVHGAVARFTGYLLDRLQAGQTPGYLRPLRLALLAPALRWFSEATGLPLPPVPSPDEHSRAGRM